MHIAASSEATGFDRIPAQEELSLSPEAKYFYYCANNTIFGTAWKYVPETGSVPLVCDMSSEILSHPVDVSKYGIVYAGAQKNMAPAGLTVVIIDRALAGHERAVTPLMMSYQRMIDKDSMYNTPRATIFICSVSCSTGSKSRAALRAWKSARAPRRSSSMTIWTRARSSMAVPSARAAAT